MMGSHSELLVNSIKQLNEKEWKEFKWRLKERRDISVSELEKADVFNTVDRMVGCYKPKHAVEVTLGILKKMSQNQLAEDLENKHKEAVEVTLGILKKMNQNQLAEDLENKHKEEIIASPVVKIREEFLQLKQSEMIPNPENRQQFLQYSNELTLDRNTVNEYIRLSERDRVIKHSYKEQKYEDHPDRFDCHFRPQVLCRESVSGRSYWEIEWTGEAVYVSVSYKSIMRKGEGRECLFGDNDKSWSLFCSPSSYSFSHNKIPTHFPLLSGSHRIGVYVDHSAGTLSFYSVSHTIMTLIHSIQTTFTQPLYPGFGVYSTDSSVKLCDLTM